MILTGILATVLGAVGWHVRGGGFVDLGRTQVARLLGIAILTAPLVFVAPWWLVLGIILTLFVGVASIGWGDFFDMGTTDGNSNELMSPLIRSWLDPKGIWHDIVGMSLTGIWIIIPTAGLLFFFGYSFWWLVLIAGLMMSVVYYCARHVLPKINIPLYGRQEQSPGPETSLAELLQGGLFGIAIFLALVL